MVCTQPAKSVAFRQNSAIFGSTAANAGNAPMAIAAEAIEIVRSLFTC